MCSKLYPDILLSLNDAIEVEWRLENELVESGIVNGNCTSLLSLERTVLDLAASECTQGVVLVTKLKAGNRSVLRFFESGSFLGFIHGKAKGIFQNDHNEQLYYRTYTTADISKRSAFLCSRSESIGTKRKKSTGSHSKPRNRSGQTYTRFLENCKRDLKILSGVGEKSEIFEGLFIHVVRMTCSSKQPDNVFTYNWGLEDDLQQNLQSELSSYRTEGHHSCESLSDVMKLKPSNLDLSEQFNILSVITNYHWERCPHVGGQARKGTLSKVGYMRHLAYQQSQLGKTYSSFLPSSVRNRLIYFTVKDMVSDRHRLLNYLLSPGSLETYAEEIETTDNHVEFSRCIKRVAKVSPLSIENLIGDFEVTNISNKSSLYVSFKTALVEHGKMAWRIHTSDTDVVVINDYSCKTGEMAPQSYVMVTRLLEEHKPYYICTCQVYEIILASASSKSNQDVLPESMTCMHCRFFCENIEPRYDQIFCADSAVHFEAYTPVDKFLKASVTSLAIKVLQISDTSNSKKFAVNTEDCNDCHFVNFSYDGSFLSCQSGECQAKGLKHKRSAARLVSLEQAALLCPHMKMMWTYKEQWNVECNVDVSDSDRDDPDEDMLELNQNSEVEIDKVFTSGNFNAISQEWDFGGLSEHKPAPENSQELSKSIQKRMLINDLSELHNRNPSGCFSTVSLQPDLMDKCDCMAGFSNEEYHSGKLQVDYKGILYMRHGPAEYVVYRRECLNPQNPCIQRYSGESDHIHFFSKETAAGDEIGWDFCNKVLSSKTTFSAFCQEMTRTYKSINVLSASFMSKATFVSWFFSWAAKMKIDFREKSDPWCTPNPRVLACDGTHIGITAKNLKLQPIENSQSEDIWTPIHRRYDRVLLYYHVDVPDEHVRASRSHLQYMCKKWQNKIEQLDLLGEETEQQKNAVLLNVCPRDNRCIQLLSNFVNCVYPVHIMSKLASFLEMLAGDQPVIAVFAYRYLDVIEEISEVTPYDSEVSFLTIKNIVPELYDVLKESLGSPIFNHITDFTLYLCEFVRKLHSSDRKSEVPVPIEDSYNPETGVAYYFTKHGNKVRKLPKYVVSSGNSNHDDIPGQDELCRKKYTKVSLGGWSHLFLWFCPIHGHCLGFHIISGSEGRKDPFSSAFLFLEEPPEEVFYDFACSLSEYSLNREPEFWRNTRFWHDLFHGYVHKCGKMFKSSRIKLLHTINSEICEQFNSFLQCIKYTGTHLSQTHFCFYVQFMIWIWNEKKTFAFNQKLKVALAGSS